MAAYSGGVLLLAHEDKPSGPRQLELAMSDHEVKLGGCHLRPEFYGSMPFLLLSACAGNVVKFGRCTCDGQVRPAPDRCRPVTRDLTGRDVWSPGCAHVALMHSLPQSVSPEVDSGRANRTLADTCIKAKATNDRLQPSAPQAIVHSPAQDTIHPNREDRGGVHPTRLPDVAPAHKHWSGVC